jgi:CheY-like chemotaxis protein
VEERQPIAILAVDDEPGVLALVRRCLESEHVMFTQASSGQDAIDTVQKGLVPDLLITDLRMPGMSGDELARQLRARQPDLRVLYLTGYTDHLFDAKQHLWAAEAYLEKPFTRAALREAAALLVFGCTTALKDLRR